MKAAQEWDMARQAFLAGDLNKALEAVDHSLALNDKVVKSHVLRELLGVELDRAGLVVTHQAGHRHLHVPRPLRPGCGRIPGCSGAL